MSYRFLWWLIMCIISVISIWATVIMIICVILVRIICIITLWAFFELNEWFSICTVLTIKFICMRKNDFVIEGALNSIFRKKINMMALVSPYRSLAPLSGQWYQFKNCSYYLAKGDLCIVDFAAQLYRHHSHSIYPSSSIPTIFQSVVAFSMQNPRNEYKLNFVLSNSYHLKSS